MIFDQRAIVLFCRWCNDSRPHAGRLQDDGRISFTCRACRESFLISPHDAAKPLEILAAEIEAAHRLGKATDITRAEVVLPGHKGHKRK